MNAQIGNPMLVLNFEIKQTVIFDPFFLIKLFNFCIAWLCFASSCLPKPTFSLARETTSWLEITESSNLMLRTI